MSLSGGPEVEETARFVETFDKFFDALNVTNFSDGRRKRKAFQLPYKSGKDFRLKVRVYTYMYMYNAYIHMYDTSIHSG